MSISKPWLWLPSQWSHHLASPGLRTLAFFRKRSTHATWRPLKWKGLSFSNPLGIAGGVDKNGTDVASWWKFGAGFVEIGTVTPRPQGPNPGRILDRNSAQKILWNRMGFPSLGLEHVKNNLKNCLKNMGDNKPVIFINVGKNRETSNENAAQDYLDVMNGLHPFADAFVINLSSPNTKDLRKLLLPEFLKPFLSEVLLNAPGQKPTLLKLSPDMTDHEIFSAIDIALDLKVDGFILTNSMANTEQYFPQREGGGVSGLALAQKSLEILKKVKQHLEKLNSNALLISVGGVLSSKDVIERLDSGANLIQVYSALIFEGPHFFNRMAKELAWP